MAQERQEEISKKKDKFDRVEAAEARETKGKSESKTSALLSWQL